MEKVSARPLSWSISVHNIVEIKGNRTVHRCKNGDFEFETVTLELIDANGKSEEFGVYSQVEGSLTRIPVTSTD